MAALQVLAVIKNKNKPVSEVCHLFDPLPQVLKNVRVRKAVLDKEPVARSIDQARERLGAGGRLLIRASGTEPVIRVMGEGDDRALVEQVVDDVCGLLDQAAAAA